MFRPWIDELDPLPEDPGFELRLDSDGRVKCDDIKRIYADWYSKHERRMTLEERQHAQYAYDHLIPPDLVARRVESVPSEHHLHRVFLTKNYYDYTYPVFAALRLYYVEQHKDNGFHEQHHLKALTTFKRGRAAKLIAQRYRLSSNEDVFGGDFKETYPGQVPPRTESWPCIDFTGAQDILAERDASVIDLVSSEDEDGDDSGIAEAVGMALSPPTTSKADIMEQGKRCMETNWGNCSETTAWPVKPTGLGFFNAEHEQSCKRPQSDGAAAEEEGGTAEDTPSPKKKPKKAMKMVKRRLKEAENKITQSEQREHATQTALEEIKRELEAQKATAAELKRSVQHGSKMQLRVALMDMARRLGVETLA
ncbi:uncharacterized protein F5Z01DRAFT_24642 [Emericellopsis atlantica]|uniref:Uncharacterized protein n=1 Tax=Emericellopsis atlantica TaxID=2614577 RepID=A0A9P7ZVN4_9HYPO|nr:uncharacterized protein F5Z01DRAFT_24642 [Emericellopsis atlantica]KAG9259090.1 hypothetical protein F5Z01DRAFT_24642 [Emericellopsis atlantica]